MRMRTAAAQLTRAELSSPQVIAIVELLPKAGAAALPALLEVFRNRLDEAVSRKLLEQLATISPLPPATVRSVLASHPESIRKAADTLLAKGTNEASRARLDQLSAELPKGDVRRGHQLFQSAKSACVTCHAMAYVGGNLGPDLTKIGGVRTERDLLEAIVFPSASFVRSYEPVFVKTRTAGDQFGIVKKDDAEEVVLATGPGTESQVARADVTTIEPAPISLMPQGYDGIFTPQELADLVAFLKAAK
jgi:putative heme-binding domain-containing protein